MEKQEKKRFQARLEIVVENLMKATGIRNRSELGYWLWKKKDRSAEMYLAQVKYQCYQNYALIVIDRCVEEGVDLNVVFGKGKFADDYNALLNKYSSLEKQVQSLIKQNESLIEENKKIGEEFRGISKSSHELMLKYMELVNKGK